MVHLDHAGVDLIRVCCNPIVGDPVEGRRLSGEVSARPPRPRDDAGHPNVIGGAPLENAPQRIPCAADAVPKIGGLAPRIGGHEGICLDSAMPEYREFSTMQNSSFGHESCVPFGTWSFTGPLATSRWAHTATLLPSGEVLVAAGFSDTTVFVALNSAELYSPATGTWSTTGSLATARAQYTATLLPNHQVLAAGGTATVARAPLSSAELYPKAIPSPATPLWALLSLCGMIVAAGGFTLRRRAPVTA